MAHSSCPNAPNPHSRAGPEADQVAVPAYPPVDVSVIVEVPVFPGDGDEIVMLVAATVMPGFVTVTVVVPEEVALIAVSPIGSRNRIRTGYEAERCRGVHRQGRSRGIARRQRHLLDGANGHPCGRERHRSGERPRRCPGHRSRQSQAGSNGERCRAGRDRSSGRLLFLRPRPSPSRWSWWTPM